MAIEEKPLTHEELDMPEMTIPGTPKSEPSPFVSKRKLDLGENKSQAIFVGGGVFLALLVGVFAMSHKSTPGLKNATPVKKPVHAGPRRAGPFVPGDQASPSADDSDAEPTSPKDLESTKDREIAQSPQPGQTSSGNGGYGDENQPTGTAMNGSGQYGSQGNGAGYGSQPQNAIGTVMNGIQQGLQGGATGTSMRGGPQSGAGFANPQAANGFQSAVGAYNGSNGPGGGRGRRNGGYGYGPSGSAMNGAQSYASDGYGNQPVSPAKAYLDRARQSLNSIPKNFQAPAFQRAGTQQNASAETGGGYGADAGGGGDMAGAGGGAEQARAYEDEVEKPSLIFVAQSTTTAGKGGAAQGALTEADTVTNFGLTPGYHVAAHLEASVSTVGGAPAVAVIEYDVTQNGKVIIPAGSRAIGKIAGASSTGIVNMSFNELFLPKSDVPVPINATGLDQNLHQIKGTVTGHNYLRQFAIASITSAGSLGAGFFSGNSSGTITQTDLAKEQIASNVGNAGDQQIQQLNVSQNLVVTVPAGKQMYVTFISPVKQAVGAQAGNGKAAAKQ